MHSCRAHAYEERRVSPSFTTLPQGQFASGGGAQTASSVRMPTFFRLPARSRCPPTWQSIARVCHVPHRRYRSGWVLLQFRKQTAPQTRRRDEGALNATLPTRSRSVSARHTWSQMKQLSTLDPTASIPNQPPSVDTHSDETAVHARLIRLCTQLPTERGHPPLTCDRLAFGIQEVLGGTASGGDATASDTAACGAAAGGAAACGLVRFPCPRSTPLSLYPTTYRAWTARMKPLSTLDLAASIPNILPSVDTPDETARPPVHARLIRLYTQNATDTPDETARSPVGTPLL